MSKKKKFDIAKTLEDTLSENPAIQKIIDKMFFKKSIKYGLVMACLTAGLFSVVNGVIIFLELGGIGWIVCGTILSLFGGVYTLKQLRKNG